MADVFISYKREDRAWAERIDAALRDAGYSTWWDTSLVAGEHFNEAIDRELGAARCVIVIWSQAARQSRWVNAEAVAGFDRGILVACRLDDVSLTYPFSVVQTADLRLGGITGVVEEVQRVVAPASGGADRTVAHAAPLDARPLTIDHKRRGALGWILIATIALATSVSVFAVLEGERGVNVGSHDWKALIAACVIFGYPLLGGAGSLLIASSVAQAPVVKLWWQTMLWSGVLGAAATALLWLFFVTRAAPTSAVISFLGALTFAFPPGAAGIGARYFGLRNRARAASAASR